MAHNPCLDPLDEATKRFVIGVGCRKHASFDSIVAAIAAGLTRDAIERMPANELMRRFDPIKHRAYLDALECREAAKPVASVKPQPVRMGG